MKHITVLACAIGYTLNIIAIFYGFHDFFTVDFAPLGYLQAFGLLAFRVVGLTVWPLGVVLGFF